MWEILSGNIDKIEEFNRLQQDRAGFVQGVQTAQTGVSAELTRVEVRGRIEELEREEAANRRAVQKRLLDEQDRENFQALEGGFERTFGGFALTLGQWGRDTAILLGSDREQFIADRQRNEFLGGSEFSEADLSRRIGPPAPAQDNGELVQAVQQQTSELQALRQQQHADADRQVQATRENKPRPASPLDRQSRPNRGG
jgi:hypothetical protein